MEKKIDNEYLNERLAEIIDDDNFFDAILKLKEFEKEYKTSDFYKITKLSLFDIVRDARIFYLTNTKFIKDKANNVINGLNTEQLLSVLEEGNSLLEAHNDATLAQIKEFKDYGGFDIAMNEIKMKDNK